MTYWLMLNNQVVLFFVSIFRLSPNVMMSLVDVSAFDESHEEINA